MSHDFSLYELLLPNTGYLFANRFVNEQHQELKSFAEKAALIEWAASVLLEKDNSVCVSLASYLTEDKPTKANFKCTKTLWLDMDVGSGDKRFPDKEAALAFLTEHLPTPTAIVDSGVGLHAYWQLSELINTERRWRVHMMQIWRLMGQRLDGNAKSIVQMLRMPGSFNGKPAAQCRASLIAFNPEIVVSEVSQKEEVQSEVEPTVFSVEISKVTRVCNQVKHFMENAKAEEPLWYALAGVFAFASDGEEVFHKISALDPRYKREETETKLTRQLAFGSPTSCQHFVEINPTLCVGCPYRGSRSPLYATMREFQISLPIVPKGYLVDESVTDRNGDVIVDGRLLVKGVGVDVTMGHEVIDIEMKSNAVRPKTFQIPASSFAEKTKFAALMLANGVVPPGVKKFDGVVDYLYRAYSINRDTHGVSEGKVFGWSHDGLRFFCGRTCYEAKRVMANRVFAQSGNQLMDTMSENGLPKRWFSALEVATPMQWFMLALSVANPLLTYYPHAPGAVVSLHGDSGGAKTSALYLGASVWGNPRAYVMTLSDTFNFVLERAGRLGTFPIYVDEMTGASPAAVGDFVYTVATGASRGRLNQAGAEHSRYVWNSLVSVTTNSSWWNKLASDPSTASEAKLLRLLEFKVPSIRATYAQSMQFDAIKQNYGHLKHVLIPLLLSFSPETRTEMMTMKAEQITAKYRMSNKQRFWTLILTASEVGFDLLKMLNLAPSKKIATQIEEMVLVAISRQHDESKTSIVSKLLDGFLLFNQRNTLTMRGGAVVGSAIELGRFPICVRSDEGTNKLLVSAQALRNYVRNSKTGMVYEDVLELLRNAKLLIEEEHYANITSGINTLPVTMLRCLTIRQGFSGK